MVNLDGVAVSALSEFVGDTIAAPPPVAAPRPARQSVFVRNPGDRPETGAGYADPFPAYRMDRASARVNAGESGMQAPRHWDFKDERRSA